MGLFNWFKKKEENVTKTAEETLPEIKKEDFVDDIAPEEDNSVTITYGTGMPIDLIYSFLKEDYETKGYDDALANPDLSYREKNKSIIKSNLEIKFKQVRLRYTDVLRDIDFHISSRKQAGLVDLVRELETRKETLEHHLEELNKMEQDFWDEKPYLVGMLLSYDKGFARGLAALSIEKIKKEF
ncbi:hypothetical protein [Phocaeicola salanitronis]|uniref:hypothetical protein n=1 Tax=Phocaeicola salanitronis TaxID=376805 RepID=UPI0023F797C0|nr:hypothetical protein [Phocaeicola salanitronis]